MIRKTSKVFRSCCFAKLEILCGFVFVSICFELNESDWRLPFVLRDLVCYFGLYEVLGFYALFVLSVNGSSCSGFHYFKLLHVDWFVELRIGMNLWACWSNFYDSLICEIVRVALIHRHINVTSSLQGIELLPKRRPKSCFKRELLLDKLCWVFIVWTTINPLW